MEKYLSIPGLFCTVICLLIFLYKFTKSLNKDIISSHIGFKIQAPRVSKVDQKKFF